MEPVLLALLALGALFLLYARFDGLNDPVTPFLQAAEDPALYPGDFYINHAVIPRSSLAFALLRAFPFGVTSPAVVVALYLALTAVAGVATWKILGRVFQFRDVATRATLLFAAAFADEKIIDFHINSWIFGRNFTLTFVAATARLWWLYFALTGRHLLMCLMLLPINLLSLKVGWLPTGVSLVILFHERVRSWRVWAAFAAAVAPAAYVALAPGAVLAPAEKRAIFDILNHAYPIEDNPFAGPRISIALFLAGCCFLWMYAARFTAATRDRFRILLLCSLAVYLAGGAYLTWGHRIAAVPVAVLLSPARALEAATLMIYLGVLAWIARTPRLDVAERIGLMLAAICLKMTESGIWVTAAALLCAGAGALWLARRLGSRGAADAWLPRLDVNVAVALLAPLMGAYFAFNVSGTRNRLAYTPVIGFHDARLPATTTGMLRAVALQPRDRRILFADAEGGRWRARRWNYLVRKSSIWGDAYYLPTLEEVRAQRRMNAMIGSMVAALQEGRAPPGLRSGLRALRTHVIVPVPVPPAVRGWRVAARYGDWVELAP